MNCKTYEIQFEQANGTVECWMHETSKRRAIAIANSRAQRSALNEPLNIRRWLVDMDGVAIHIVNVANRT